MVQFGMATMSYGGVEIGCLQDVSIDISYSIAELYCGNGMFPQDVRVHSGKASGSAAFADLTAQAFSKLLGGTISGTSVAVTDTSRPSTFELVATLVTDGVTFRVTFPKCRSTKLAMAFVRDGHLIPNFDFSVEANDDGSVMTIDVGDLS